ncbi:hypothetical protein Q4489_09080 [Thalassotalea sp. 1_MG-2023]|nr:hypothetical protein [Thalassotalea sp. 1_MG-2023]MDO6427164.1 hypothetical protein [Thalassotalea sp. 1_MG-2023]
MTTWWKSLTKTEQSALATLGGFCLVIFLFSSGVTIGSTLANLL